MMRTRAVEELLPTAVAHVRGLGLPATDDPGERRVAVRLPKGRAAIMSAEDCRWSVLDAVYRPSPRSRALWLLLRLVPLQLLPVCMTVAENVRPPRSAPDMPDVLAGIASRRVVYVGGGQPAPSIVVASLGRDDAVSGVTRVGYDAQSCRQVAREERQLRALEAIQVPGVLWPTVTSSAQAGTVCACSSTSPAGRSAGLGTPTRDEMARAHTAIVTASAHERVLGEVLPADIPHKLAAEILGDMPQGWRDVVIPCAVVHGDFAPWNGRVVGEDVFLFDWTNGSMSGPAFFDRLYLEHQLQRLISRGGPRECADLLTGIARTKYRAFDADLVVRVYLLWRLADALFNNSEPNVTEVATIWEAVQGGSARA